MNRLFCLCQFFEKTLKPIFPFLCLLFFKIGAVGADVFAGSKKENCASLSGIHRFPQQSFSIGFKGRALSAKALKILKEAELSNQKHCPANCRQENVYKTFIQIQPARFQPGSCPSFESKETYSFKKTYSLDAKEGGATAAAEAIGRATLASKMDDWILRTFVYPYIPGLRFTPTKEGLERKTAEACPKCSFYFNYNYFFEDDRTLSLDITVHCGDRKKGLSLARAARLQIQNHWRCRD